MIPAATLLAFPLLLPRQRSAAARLRPAEISRALWAWRQALEQALPDLIGLRRQSPCPPGAERAEYQRRPLVAGSCGSSAGRALRVVGRTAGGRAGAPWGRRLVGLCAVGYGCLARWKRAHASGPLPSCQAGSYAQACAIDLHTSVGLRWPGCWLPCRRAQGPGAAVVSARRGNRHRKGRLDAGPMAPWRGCKPCSYGVSKPGGGSIGVRSGSLTPQLAKLEGGGAGRRAAMAPYHSRIDAIGLRRGLVSGLAGRRSAAASTPLQPVVGSASGGFEGGKAFNVIRRTTLRCSEPFASRHHRGTPSSGAGIRRHVPRPSAAATAVRPRCANRCICTTRSQRPRPHGAW